MKLCALILAAGGSSRLGRPKQLVKQHDKTLLEKAIESAIGTGLQDVFVVLGARFDKIKANIEGLAVTIVQNEQWQEGIGTSISAGMKAVVAEGHYDAVLIMLCDQLYINPRHIQDLVNAYQEEQKAIIATLYDAQAGVPALFDKKYFPHLRELSHDIGAKRIIHQHPKEVYSIPFEKAAIDIDTPEDLEKTGLN